MCPQSVRLILARPFSIISISVNSYNFKPSKFNVHKTMLSWHQRTCLIDDRSLIKISIYWHTHVPDSQVTLEWLWNCLWLRSGLDVFDKWYMGNKIWDQVPVVVFRRSVCCIVWVLLSHININVGHGGSEDNLTRPRRYGIPNFYTERGQMFFTLNRNQFNTVCYSFLSLLNFS